MDIHGTKSALLLNSMKDPKFLAKFFRKVCSIKVSKFNDKIIIEGYEYKRSYDSSQFKIGDKVFISKLKPDRVSLYNTYDVYEIELPFDEFLYEKNIKYPKTQFKNGTTLLIKVGVLMQKIEKDSACFE